MQLKKELIEENINLENAKYRLENDIRSLTREKDVLKTDLSNVQEREVELKRKLRLIFDILMGEASKESKAEVLMDLLGVNFEKNRIEEEKKKDISFGYKLNNDGIGRRWDY